MAGAPSKFDSAMCEKVTKLCLLGATDEQLADFFDVCVATIYNWKLEHPEFLEAIKDGKENADAKVAKSLYQTAIDGNTTAQIFWLKNRRSKEWRDKQEINLQSEDGSMSPAEISDDDLSARLRELGIDC
jgi:hypothetical protein